MQTIKELRLVIGGFIGDVFTFPMVLLIIVWLFKKPIYDFINSISLITLKFGNNTLSIAREFKSKGEIIDRGLNSRKKGTPIAAGKLEALADDTAEIRLEIAIPQAFMLIETALFEAARRINIRERDDWNIAATLCDMKKLDTEIFIYIISMMNLKEKLVSFSTENINKINIDEKDIAVYRKNAERIAAIITAIE
jgi:hypothetical protein